MLKSPRPVKVIHNARFEQRILAAVGITLEGVFDTLDASRQAHGRDALGGIAWLWSLSASSASLSTGSDRRRTGADGRWNLDQLPYPALDEELLLVLHDRFRTPAHDRRPGQSRRLLVDVELSLEISL